MLTSQFVQIMQDVQASNQNTRYELQLPKTTDSNKGIPVSLIAKQLADKLFDLELQQNTIVTGQSNSNSNSSGNPSRRLSKRLSLSPPGSPRRSLVKKNSKKNIIVSNSANHNTSLNHNKKKNSIIKSIIPHMQTSQLQLQTKSKSKSQSKSSQVEIDSKNVQIEITGDYDSNENNISGISAHDKDSNVHDHMRGARLNSVVCVESATSTPNTAPDYNYDKFNRQVPVLHISRSRSPSHSRSPSQIIDEKNGDGYNSGSEFHDQREHDHETPESVPAVAPTVTVTGMQSVPTVPEAISLVHVETSLDDLMGYNYNSDSQNDRMNMNSMNKNQNNNNNKKKKSRRSSMKIQTQTRYIDKNNINVNNRKRIIPNDKSFAICDAIIECFEQLYVKYVRDSADYMININSHTRYTLKFMFDAKFYAIWAQKQAKNNNGTKNNKEKDRKPKSIMSDIDLNIWDRIKYESILAWKNNRLNGNSSASNLQTQENFTRAKLRIFAEMTPNLTQDELFEWLFAQLIQATESAIMEISKLMKDSYTRFRRESNMFPKVLKLAQDHVMSAH